MKVTERIAALAVFVTVGFLAVAAFGASPATSERTATAAGSQTYEDATGESPAAPDIGTVIVTNDDGGMVSFAVRFANRSVLGPTEMVLIQLNTDPTAGDPASGFDYTLGYLAGTAALLRWDSATQDWALATASTLRSAWAAPTLTLQVNASELGEAEMFAFRVVADSNPADPNAAWDSAPGSGLLWMYIVDVHVAPQLSISSIACTPSPAVKGKPMVGKATVVMTRAGEPEALPATAKVTWTATLGGVRLKPVSTSRAPNGVLLSKWKVPKATKAKALRVTLTVTVENVTVTKTHVHRVK